MKKSRLFMLCLALIMGVSVFTFAGCSDGAKSPGSGGTVESGGGTGNGGGTSGGGSGSGGGTTTDPVVTEPQLKTMSTYFSGLKAEYAKTGLTDQNGQTKTFEYLLDRQFDVLAQDILYRLSYVYGSSSDSGDNRIEVVDNNNYLKLTGTTNYSYDGKDAIVNIDSLLTSSELSHDSSHSVTNLDLTCLQCYQLAIKDTTSSRNYLYYDAFMNFVGAIQGKNTTLEMFLLADSTATENLWVGWNSSLNSTYDNVLTTYKNNFKMALAQILAGQQTTGEYVEQSYNDLLTKINVLGFSNAASEDIVNFINTKVIGSALIEKDKQIYNSDYFKNKNYIVDSSFMANAPYPGNANYTTEQNENSPRLYKGYNIVVPAIVEQALSNTFEGTSTSLYPKLNRYAIEDSSSATGLTIAKQYRSIVLKPKNNTPTTKLVLEVAGNGNTVGKTITIGYEVVIAGTRYSATKNVTLAATATEVELNLNSITSGAKLNAYDGTNSSYNQTALFGTNSEFDSNGNLANKDGNNYIKLNFTGAQGGSFVVGFKGLYDKV